jgi:hypothetical protein
MSKYHDYYPFGKKSLCRCSIEDTGYGDMLCMEGYSGRLFYSSMRAVNDALRKWSKRFKEGDNVSFNDLYDLLNIVQTGFGHQWGYLASYDWYKYDSGISYKCYLRYDEDLKSDVYYIDILTFPMDGWNLI